MIILSDTLNSEIILKELLLKIIIIIVLLNYLKELYKIYNKILIIHPPWLIFILSGHNFILPASHLEKSRIDIREDVGRILCRAKYFLEYFRQSFLRLVSDRFEHIIP